MNKKLLGSAIALGLAAPVAFAGGVGGGNADSTWTIYGWQNYSYEFTEAEGGGVNGGDRDTQTINANAANIGFAATINTGVSFAGQAVKANFQCEQFTFHNRFNGSGFAGFNDLCNRNSKISLSGAFGEIMFGQWLLPANEMIAQWIDPFYDAGQTSHSALFGSVGYGTLFFNGGFGFDGANFGAGLNQGFNRRQNELVQYFSPNINGFNFRIATSNANGAGGSGDVAVTSATGVEELDPRIWSTGLTYEKTLANGNNVWVGATYQRHDEWAAVDFACSDSQDDTMRLAGRYIHQWANGMSTRISVAYEQLEYDWDDCAGGTLLSANGAIQAAGASDLELEKDTWLISGIQSFGNGFDFRFTYVDSGEFDCDTCITDDDTDATHFVVGGFYTFPAGTELRLTYNQIDNEDNANYNFGINGAAGATIGEDISSIGLGIVQWF